MKKNKFTTKGAYFYEDFETGLQYLEKPLLIWTDVWNERFGLGRGEYIAFIVPKGKNNDGASIPKFVLPVLWLCPRSKEIALPATGHDFGYEEQEFEVFIYNKKDNKLVRSLGVQEFSQKEMDLFIRDKMEKMGANIYDRNMVYAGLRIGGHVAWNEHRQRILKNKK